MISKMSHSGGHRVELVTQYAGQKPLPAGTRVRVSKYPCVKVRLVVTLPDTYGCPFAFAAPFALLAVNVRIPSCTLTASGTNACFCFESVKNCTPQGPSVFHLVMS